MARSLVEELRPVSQDLRCEAELEGVLEILERGTGAERQRTVFREDGFFEKVVDDLMRFTAPA